MSKTITIFALILWLAGPAFAVTTSHWTHTNASDWKSGTFHGVVATNLGDLKLSRQVKTILEQDERISAVQCLLQSHDGTIYAGTGPQGVLMQIKDDKASTLLSIGDGVSILSLLETADGKLLLGTGGEKGQILQVEQPGQKPKVLFGNDEVQYIWAMVQSADGNIYAATGPTGKLYEIKPDGTSQAILETQENNLLAMTTDGKDTLYVGTDPNGLVYRINRRTHESFVLYDAAESEIGALALDSAGNLYAGTAEATDQPGSANESNGEKTGRPEPTPDGMSIPPAPTDTNLPQTNATQNRALSERMTEAGNFDVFASVEKHAQPPAVDPEQAAKPTPPGAEPGGNNPHGPGPATAPDVHPGGVTPNTGNQPRAGGNAVYRIDPEGFVTEVFREPVMVFAIVPQENSILVATGGDGLVFEIHPAAQETTVVAKVDPKQVTAMFPLKDGRIALGLSNVGGLSIMSSGYGSNGTYESPVQDAGQISRFGEIQLHGTLPDGTTLKLSTRSGNVKEPSDNSWSKWSADSPAAEFVPAQAPAARFFQYRLTLSTKSEQVSPALEDIDVAYRSPNVAPVVKSVKIVPQVKPGGTAGGGEGESSGGASINAPSRIQIVSWEASDANNDPLIYAVYCRASAKGPWILLKDKLKEATFEWDTRTTADGRYYVKVVASDEAANPVGQGKTASRISDPMTVDNTPPTFSDIKTTVKDGVAQVQLKAMDKTSTVAGVDYSVDSNQDWQAAEASDKIFDSPVEGAEFTITGLSPGPHQITVRATDSRGNQGFENLLVNVESPKATK